MWKGRREDTKGKKWYGRKEGRKEGRTRKEDERILNEGRKEGRKEGRNCAVAVVGGVAGVAYCCLVMPYVYHVP